MHDLDLQPYLKFPACGDKARIGLFGGSFNPPHQGHLNLCDLALKRLDLDQIWWMVTPGNPLKNTSQLPGLPERVEWCKALVSDPRIRITAFEAKYRVRYTADTIRLIRDRYPRQRFVWLMGADNLANFHQWQHWRRIADLVPFAVIDRPGSTLACRSAPAALALSRYRVDECDGRLLMGKNPPAWTFFHGPRNPLSSTVLRNRQKPDKPMNKSFSKVS